MGISLHILYDSWDERRLLALWEGVERWLTIEYIGRRAVVRIGGLCWSAETGESLSL